MQTLNQFQIYILVKEELRFTSYQIATDSYPGVATICRTPRGLLSLKLSLELLNHLFESYCQIISISRTDFLLRIL